ncbi:adiponectin-like isoform X2 [Crassostrea virginica]
MTDVDLKSLVLQTKSKNDTAFGFTTRLSGRTYSSSSSIIRGSRVLYNGGNAYNGTVFTCPSPGLYLFHVSVVTHTKSYGIWIYKNSQQLTLAYSGNGDPQYNGASVSAVVWLDVGDQVYLRPNGLSLFVDGNSAFTGIKVN